MENLNKTPTSGRFNDIARTLDQNFSLISACIMELEANAERTSQNFGFYASEEALKLAYPNPTKGMMAYVGTGDTYMVYRCTTEGTWTKTDETFKLNIGIDVNTLVTKDELDVVKATLDGFMQGAVYGGAATTITNPGTPKYKVFYLPTEDGTYENFGGLEVHGEMCFLAWDGKAWAKQGFSVQETLERLENELNSVKATAINANSIASQAKSTAEANSKTIGQHTEKLTEQSNTLASVQQKVENLDVPKVVCMTQAQYDALTEKDPNTTYLTTEE